MEGKAILITASTGIGAETARLAARAGARLFITSKTESHCSDLARQIRQEGGACAYRQADLRNAAQVEMVVEDCVETYGRIDALYNVAGISGSRFGDGPVHECTESGWDMVMATNVKSMYLMCRLVIGQMMMQPIGSNGLRGTLLNMASVLGICPMPSHFVTHGYAASKGAIIGMSRSMAGYYAPHKIRVNVIAPGLTGTPMAGRAVEDEQIRVSMKQKQALTGGVIDAAEVARASLFLLSDDSRAVTGDTLVVDGGWCVTG